MQPCLRFAPSPTGRLHLGNARIAVVNWLGARCRNGRFLLRFDDTDRLRCRPEHEREIRDDLRWLGLSWDAEFRQSERGELYARAFERLRAAGRVYPCYESAEELSLLRRTARREGKPPRYPRSALGLTPRQRRKLEEEGRRPHWRFLLSDRTVAWRDAVFGEKRVDLGALSDPVIRRSDGSWTYLFASVVDDTDLRITEIIRGEDHLTNSALQLDLFAALDARPPALAHLPLLLGPDGQPLSKRSRALSLAALREQGIEPAAIRVLLARLGTGLPLPADAGLEGLCRGFNIAAFGRAPARLDIRELARLSRRFLRTMPFSKALSRLGDAGMERLQPAAWELLRANLERFDDIFFWQRVLEGPLEPVVEDRELLTLAERLLPERLVDVEEAAAWLERLAEESGRRGRALYQPLRLALTARRHGPELKHLLPLIGRERIAARLRGRCA